jgi:hypothetical protein
MMPDNGDAASDGGDTGVNIWNVANAIGLVFIDDAVRPD